MDITPTGHTSVDTGRPLSPSIVEPRPTSPSARDRQIAAFAERYGRDAYPRLLAQLGRPCVSFATIAVEFGVSRERVRQWRVQWAPETPTGVTRRQQCLATRRRQRLLEHPVFRAFYQQIRRHVPSHRFGLIEARNGFRTRIVRIDNQVAFLTTARRLSQASDRSPVTYALPPVPEHAVYVYVQLENGDDFLFLPATALPTRGTTFVDTASSKYQRYRRTFAAIDTVAD